MKDASALLDSQLGEHDPEGLDWNEYACNAARQSFRQLPLVERSQLMQQFATRPAAWRHCFINLLDPSFPAEGMLLIEAIWDEEEIVHFEALKTTAYYCGVNSSTKRGSYVDDRIRVQSFLEAAVRCTGLIQKVDEIAAKCSTDWKIKFSLLASELSGK